VEVKVGTKSGKRLGGEPPRRRGRWRGPEERVDPGARRRLLAAFALGLFVLGGVAGYAWGLDRQIRGGILRQRAQEVRRSDWVPIRSLPSYVPDAFAAVVEPTLLRRGGLDVSGGGTSMARELVRQVHLLPASPPGELEELAMAPVLEKHLRPVGLVELYLNRVYLGRSMGAPVYGVWHAAREYFDTEPSQLTLGQAATLAGLLLEPRIEDPDQRVGAVGVRRNEVLKVMLSGGLITPAQYAAAVAEPLAFQPGLEQMPMSRPADWGAPPSPLRLPPNLRPVPKDSTTEEESR
jgi:membrane peptidoglycan carboxypeptidase